MIASQVLARSRHRQERRLQLRRGPLGAHLRPARSDCKGLGHRSVGEEVH